MVGYGSLDLLIMKWMISYNEELPHDALGGLPPVAFRERVEAENPTLEMSNWRGSSQSIG